MKWCAVHKRYCEDTAVCIAQAVRITPDPAEYIIEKSIAMQPAWHNSRINYRLKRWMSADQRYEFLGDFFWLGKVHNVLRNEFGFENPQDVPVVDLTDF